MNSRVKNFLVDLVKRGFRGKALLFWARRKALLGIEDTLYEEDRRAIDVVIPCTSKDLEVLPITIENLRKKLFQPINKVHVIVPAIDEKSIVKIQQMDCQLHFDHEAAPFARELISYRVAGLDRTGWLFQQFIKLNADSIASTEDFLIFDADTILLKPTSFFNKGKTVFFFSDEFHLPYFALINKLFPGLELFKASFVAHGMLLNKKVLSDLKRDLEGIANGAWYSAILNCCDFTEKSCFSEYELYANYFINQNSSKVVTKYWCNRSYERRLLDGFKTMKIPKFVRTASFHAYVENQESASGAGLK